MAARTAKARKGAAPVTPLVIEHGEIVISVSAVEAAPALAIDPDRFRRFFEALKAEVAIPEPDLLTQKGRDAIASAAYRVARMKTAIDGAGKDLNASKRREIDAVDAQRREIWAALEGLQKEIRKPLDEWEAEDRARRQRSEEIMQMLRTATLLPANSTAEDIGQRITWLKDLDVSEGILVDQQPTARALRDEAIPELEAAKQRAAQAESAAAELERARAEVQRLAEEQARRAAEAAPAQTPEPEKPPPQGGPAASFFAAVRETIFGETPDPAVAEPVAAIAQPHNDPRPGVIRRAQAISAMVREGEITEAQAAMIVDAIVEGHIPHVRIAL